MRCNVEVGQKYGKWLVIKFDEVDQKRRRRFICRCECGIEKSLTASNIANGRTKSCTRCKAVDLVGRQFGKWIVIAKHGKSSKHRHTLWLCRCDCGKENLVERCNLIRGKSNGCWECQRNVISTNYFPKAWYRKQIEQSKLRGLTWNISEDYLLEILTKQHGKCALTGMKLIIDVDAVKMTASIDRIDNNLGYEEGNVWFIHKHINLMKYKWEVDYFVEMCELVAKHKKGCLRLTANRLNVR